MPNRNWPQTMILAGSLLALCGCSESAPPADMGIATDAAHSYGDYPVDPSTIQFKDSLTSNASSAGGLEQLAFVDVHGDPVEIKSLLGEKNLVVVVTRGNTNPICPYCSAQTSRLISNYAEFSKRNAEVVLVYPVEKQADSKKLDEFLESTRSQLAQPDSEIPFPILLDVELKSVKQLGIRGSLSKPATYILDKKGQVRFAYVGAGIADRPSIKALLEQLDALSDKPTETDSDSETKE